MFASVIKSFWSAFEYYIGGALWLSGSLLDLGSRALWLESHWRHCDVSLVSYIANNIFDFLNFQFANLLLAQL